MCRETATSNDNQKESGRTNRFVSLSKKIVPGFFAKDLTFAHAIEERTKSLFDINDRDNPFPSTSSVRKTVPRSILQNTTSGLISEQGDYTLVHI